MCKQRTSALLSVLLNLAQACHIFWVNVEASGLINDNNDDQHLLNTYFISGITVMCWALDPNSGSYKTWSL